MNRAHPPIAQGRGLAGLACRVARLALVVALSGCGGGPPVQTPPVRDDMTGTTTGGTTSGPSEQAGEFDAKGTTGIVRAAAVAGGSLRYDVSLIQLGGPYALRAVLFDDSAQTNVYSLAPRAGVANITPLTSLVIAQLYGQDPGSIYDAFGPGGSVDVSRITDQDLADAQAGVISYLASDVGFTVPAPVGDFITAPFEAVAGDPMYDAIVALGAHLAAQGSSFSRLTSDVAFASRLCMVERITITIGSAPGDFCPESKTSTPRPGSPTVLTDVFVDRHGNRLELLVDGDAVDSMSYATHAGARYACSGAACRGITMGPPAQDGTRSLRFAGTTLATSDLTGGASLDGSLTTAIPGVKLPVLPCQTEWFILIFDDDTTQGRCADPDPFHYGIGGVPGSLIGVNLSRGDYDFAAPAGTDRVHATVSFITDGYGPVLAVDYQDDQPGTFVPRRRYVCLLADCAGTSLGDVTVNTSFGENFPFYLRTVTFDHTPLVGVDDNGLPTGRTATLLASLVPAYPMPIPPIEYPAQAACQPGLHALPITAGSAAFNACVPDGHSSVDGNGDIHLDATDINSSDDQLSIVVHADGTVASASLSLAVVPGTFACIAPCAGIVVSGPDGQGRRNASFGSASLAEQFFGMAGPRALSMQPATLEFAPS